MPTLEQILQWLTATTPTSPVAMTRQTHTPIYSMYPPLRWDQWNWRRPIGSLSDVTNQLANVVGGYSNKANAMLLNPAYYPPSSMMPDNKQLGGTIRHESVHALLANNPKALAALDAYYKGGGGANANQFVTKLGYPAGAVATEGPAYAVSGELQNSPSDMKDLQATMGPDVWAQYQKLLSGRQ